MAQRNRSRVLELVLALKERDNRWDEGGGSWSGFALPSLCLASCFGDRRLSLYFSPSFCVFQPGF